LTDFLISLFFFDIIGLPSFFVHQFLIEEIQKRRYISAAEKMYKIKDIFFDEVKNLYKIT
jgi:hypothetical protein